MTREALTEIKDYLKNYDGEPINIMEVCGSHTAAIAKSGIKSLLSEKINLVSGPGCPVCVTPSAYIDRLIELSLKPDTCVCTFGDLLRVPGSTESLNIAKGKGARVEMVYSPMDIVDMAKADAATTFVFAAVGFETTTPVYALLIDTIVSEKIDNIRLLTALKTMPAVIEHLLENKAPIDAFIAPGHVSVVTGSRIFEPVSEKYDIPFAVSGFEGEQILEAIYGLVKTRGKGKVLNFYPEVVSEEGNTVAKELVDKYFEVTSAGWRGMGIIDGSGLKIRDEFSNLDAGSDGLTEDIKKNKACRCDHVLMGKLTPKDCPLYGKGCTPLNPQGACMVSEEGCCHTWISNYR
ncbi:MAG: hydrogenase formation protein HypD [Lachnospiraceae bacterium]|nr:hydrogenase formation protein HypD [Lachnospiraceae bacterium]